ncbi:MAG: endonuclease domain-containing protein [Elusimicrobiota bacterium]|jgi:very-short-patch-repair endonuclease|nr:endonuclease domain-containing protein [Elusimicrobiota bacterium]
MIAYEKSNKTISRKLRKTMTEPEFILWAKIRKGQIKNAIFYRQKPIGGYIVDFCCTKEKLVIELDGGGHYDEAAKAKDKKRDLFLASKGFKVLRFSNADVRGRPGAVLSVIWDNINPSPSGLPLQKGETSPNADKNDAK